MTRSSRPPVLASHLYDAVTCEHRIALDARLPRDRRTPPDDAGRALLRHGLEWEATYAASLGYPEVRVESGDFREAAARTQALLREGVPGIFQGVLLEEGRLARPDLLERADGESNLGRFHYVPGDVKSALHARADAALQTAFAGLLLGRVQGRRPDRAFLVLGDGSREWFRTDDVATVLEDTVDRVAGLLAGEVPSRPALRESCARCRWRDVCRDAVEGTSDASLVHGLTPALRDLLAGHGIVTVDDLAAVGVAGLRAKGLPGEVLTRVRTQAQVLRAGRGRRRGRVDLPRGVHGEHLVRLESDPFDGGSPFLALWGATPPGGGEPRAATARIMRNREDREGVFRELLADLESGDSEREPIYHFGSATSRALDRLADETGLSPSVQGRVESRLVDLAPRVRRAMVRPVHFYEFQEIAAVARDREIPDPWEPSPAPFLKMVLGDSDPLAREDLLRDAEEALRDLAAIRAWIDDSTGHGGQ